MKFDPKTEQQIQEDSLLKDGIYDFDVLDASNEVSKNGNEYIKLILKVYDDNGRPHLVYDMLMEAMAFKLIHFCQIAGIEDKYNSGELDASDCLDKSGKVRIYIQEDKTGQYFPKNSVKDYVKEDKKDIEKKEEVKQEFNDDINF